MVHIMYSSKFFYKILNLTLLVSILILGFDSCSQPDNLKIINEGDNSFASIQIHNPYGNNILIASSDTLGGIGFILNGKINWIKGQPEISHPSSNKSSYKWQLDEISVVLETEKKNNDLKFKFKLEGTQSKPSAWMINTKVKPDEYFTGIFERVVDGTQYKSWEKGITEGLNLRGQKIDVKLKPTVSAYAPFYISSGNYAFFVHGTWPGIIDFCKEQKDLVQISFRRA